MFKKNLPRLFLINITFLVTLLGAIEILLGEWRNNFLSNKKYIQIPALKKNVKLKYDGKWLYSSNDPVPIVYIRDKFGYRSRDSENNKKIFLTIGGSTTDNRFVTEGETWQDNLDKNFPKYDFINGGVDGQSSYGHLFSIREWHSKYLNSNDVNSIIFYVGINDRRLLSNKIDNWDKAQNRVVFIKNLIKDNSYFVKMISIARNKYDFLMDSHKTPADLLQVHLPRKKIFIKEGKKYKLRNKISLSSYPLYTEVFSNLLLETDYYFPNSTIYIIQQQIPGCKFINKEIVFDRHPIKDSKLCSELLKVYQVQEKIIKKSPLVNKIKVLPMYLQQIILDNDVYDYAHTNKYGSLKISEYISSWIKN